ncbi:C25 family cysteine peptidase [Modestobacter marinus]|uniref:C25 family cysteine peptidase n=1 Tax=Modestobacter marinus TaxID=477641 RepID=UPI001C96C33B|nr:C25 family cysteine peptidase [Modestobacter marinus]
MTLNGTPAAHDEDPASTSNDEMVFNGVDGTSGGYLFPPIAPATLAALLRGERLAGDAVDELQSRSAADEADYGLVFGRNPEDLAQSGWGLLAPVDLAPDVLEALTPLRELRRQQAGDLYREFLGDDGVRPGEGKQEWLARHGMGPSPADPTKVPYYLLLVGDPEGVPYRFQYQLDVQYAVGRVAFDTAEEYDNYARTVVQRESAVAGGPRSVTLFGPQNLADRATQLSRQLLVEPLAGELTDALGRFSNLASARVESAVADEATKVRLLHLLTGDGAPEVLFTAGHGVGFPAQDARQREAQGALICQEWPGPLLSAGAMTADYYLSAADIAQTAPVRPAVVFSFACFGGGTPVENDFAHRGTGSAAMATRPFVARLPQRLLGSPAGGALAFLGHVERAWGCSFTWPRAGAQRAVFSSALLAVLSGWRVGHAMEFFNARYAELSADLSEILERVRKDGLNVPDTELAGAWTANNDARSYVVVGDPAARLPVTS